MRDQREVALITCRIRLFGARAIVCSCDCSNLIREMSMMGIR